MAGSKGESAWFSDGGSALTASSSTYAGVDIRRDLSALLSNGTTRPFGSRCGRRRGAGGVPTIAGGVVTLVPGACIVDAQASGTDAPFLVSWTAAGTMPATPAESGARVDIVYVQVIETPGAPTTQQVIFGYRAGTAGSPNPPSMLADGTTPVSRVAILGYVNMPASGGGAPTITPGPEVSAAGGRFFADRDSDYPTNPAIGDQVFDSRLTYGQTWLSNGSTGYWSPDVAVTRETFRDGFTAGGSGLDVYDEITANAGEVRIVQQDTWASALAGLYRIYAKIPIAHIGSDIFASHIRLLRGSPTALPSALVPDGGTTLGVVEPVDVPAFKTHLFIERTVQWGGGDLAITVGLDSTGAGVKNRLYKGAVIRMTRSRG